MFSVLLLQVAHFEPETIHLRGEGIFPRILLNLPRLSVAGEYEELMCRARENLLKEANMAASNRLPSADLCLADVDVANSDSLVILVILYCCKPSTCCLLAFTLNQIKSGLVQATWPIKNL